MSIYEYDEERHMRQTREEGMEEGYASGLSQGLLQGIEQGIEQGITQTAVNLLKSGLLTDVQIKEITGINQKQLDELKKDINK